MTDPADEAQRVMEAVHTLIEHFDSVQIFCTLHDRDDGTLTFESGAGNWYARYGQVSEWMQKQKARTKQKVDLEDFESGEEGLV